MRIFFQHLETWERLNQAVREQFPESLKQTLKDYEVRLYPSVPFAINEAFFGLKSLFSFKKKALFYKGQDPYVEEGMKSVASLGLSITGKNLDDIKSAHPPSEILERDTCFITYAASDPILGKVWPVQFLDKSASDVCPRVRVDYLGQPSEFRHYVENGIYIFGEEAGAAIMILGPKVQFRSFFCSQMVWPETEVVSGLPTPSKLISEEEFLRHMSPHFLPFFSSDEPKATDRVSLYNAVIDGSAIVAKTLQMMPELDSRSKFSPLLTTPSLSLWGGLRTMDWLTAWGHDLKKIRGTIIVDRRILSDKFIKVLQKAYLSVLELQDGHQRSNKDIGFDN